MKKLQSAASTLPPDPCPDIDNLFQRLMMEAKGELVFLCRTVLLDNTQNMPNLDDLEERDSGLSDD